MLETESNVCLNHLPEFKYKYNLNIIICCNQLGKTNYNNLRDGSDFNLAEK